MALRHRQKFPLHSARALVVIALVILLACGPGPSPTAVLPTGRPDGLTAAPPATATPPRQATATAVASPTTAVHPTATPHIAPTPTVAYVPVSDLPEGRRLGLGRVTALAWTQEGQLIVGTTIGVYLYDVESLAQVAFLETPTPVTTLVLSPRGDLLAAAGPRGLWLWETVTWQSRDAPPGVRGLPAFSPDGSLLAAADDSGLHVWEIAAWQEQWSVEGVWGGLTFSPDGNLLAARTRTAEAEVEVRVWNAGAWTDARVFPGAYNAAFSPAGGRLAIAGPGDYAWGATVWDTANWQEMWHADTDCGSLWGCGEKTLAYSPDGAWLALAGTVGSIWMWDSATGQAVHSALTESGLRGPIAFSPAAPLLAARTDDAQVALWRLDQDERVGVLAGYGGLIDSVALSPDGTLLAHDLLGNGVRVVEVATARILWELPAYESLFATGVSSVAFSPDGTLVAAGMDWFDDTGSWGEVRLWEADTGRLARTIPVPPLGEWQDGGVYDLAFSPDRVLVAAACDGGTVRLWDAATGEVVRILTGTSSMYSIAFSLDGRFLAAGESSGDVQIWEVATGQEVQRMAGRGYSVQQVAFSPVGALLGAADTLGVHVWNVEDGHEVWRSAEPPYPLRSLAFAPDGTVLAVGQADGSIWLWDAASWQEVGTVRLHTAGVNALVFSADGALLVSGGVDGTVGLWMMER